MIWVELPPKVDAVELFRQAKAKGLVIAPGPLFTTTNRYRNFIRLSHCQSYSNAIHDGIAAVGQMASAMAR